MNTSKLLAGALLTGMGMAAGGATLAQVAAGVGVNWLGEGTAGLWAGLAAPPEAALGRAYAGAIRQGVADLKARYQREVDPRTRLHAFDLVAACADDLAGVEFPPGVAEVDAAQRTVEGGLAALLHGHDPRQAAFLRRELLPACAHAFQQQLLRHEDAWRAFHGLILQGMARHLAALSVQMPDFPALLAAWGDPAATLAALSRAAAQLEARIDALARPAAGPIFDNRGMHVRGPVYQATGNQYFNSAHAESGGNATVINTFGALPASPPPASPPPASPPPVVLLLSANPVESQPLRLDREARQIDAALRGGRGLVLAQQWAVRSGDLLDALLRHRPAIVHFAGHALTQDGQGHLLLEGADGQPAPASAATVAGLLAASGGVRCVVLNACWSDSLAEVLLGVVPCVVGMDAEVSDSAAVAFAEGFYRALVGGQAVAAAVQAGAAQAGATAAAVHLRTAPGVDASAMRFGHA